MLAALEAGLPLATGFDAPSRLPTRYAADGRGQLRRPVVPGQRQPGVDGRLPDDVGRLRPLGEHVLRLAGRAGRRRTRWSRWPSGSASRFRADADADARPRTAPRNWGSFTLGVAATTPLDLANAYATVAAEGTYCAPLPVVSMTDADGRQVPVGDAGLPAGARRRRGPGRHRRGPLPGRPAVDVRAVQRRHRHRGEPRSSAAGRWPARPAARRRTPPRRSSASPRRSRSPASPPTRTTRRDAVGAAVQARVIDAVGRILAAALADAPVRDFVPPNESIPTVPSPPPATATDPAPGAGDQRVGRGGDVAGHAAEDDAVERRDRPPVERGRAGRAGGRAPAARTRRAGRRPSGSTRSSSQASPGSRISARSRSSSPGVDLLDPPEVQGLADVAAGRGSRRPRRSPTPPTSRSSQPRTARPAGTSTSRSRRRCPR